MPVNTDESALVVNDLAYEVDDRVLLNEVNLDVPAGCSVAIMGPSGSGKTTLLMCLAGLLPPAEGTVLVGGQDMTRASTRQRARIRLRDIGVVYQFGELIPEISPKENVALPALLAGTPTGQAYARAMHLLEQMRIAELAEAKTVTLSGGERQRVAIARALINEPLLVLADEPTGALDSDTAREVTDLLFALPEQQRCALVVVTHNHGVARAADLCVQLEAGYLSGVDA
ncbi:ABC transporter ATP-binding protein [Micromonospora sp. R77]|uniref:ABC transporter ATP-binding protein n=1 Tax=Micromonospora sp. R77 TaxID=2925836 RepID=UPI001F606479|nr:ABC transporter ATP-binding protein [Micromonospora sp. R77]MCI4063442.1 ABC transporter ATP-binding protein [Micromonospora sp. R77]